MTWKMVTKELESRLLPDSETDKWRRSCTNVTKVRPQGTAAILHRVPEEAVSPCAAAFKRRLLRVWLGKPLHFSVEFAALLRSIKCNECGFCD